MKSYLRQSNRQNWENILDARKSFILSNEKFLKGDWEDEIKPEKKKPTDNQRGYYYAVILPALLNHFGSEGGIQKLHNDIKNQIADEFGLFTIETNSITGEQYKENISLSDSKGDRDSVRKFIDAVLLWAARDYGVVIPNPYLKI
jgi:hypothetical protein